MIRYIRLAALVPIIVITWYVYSSGSMASMAPYAAPLSPDRPIENVQDELFGLADRHIEYLRSLVKRVEPKIGEACSSSWNPKFLKNLFSKKSEYDSHRAWIRGEIRRLVSMAILEKVPYSEAIPEDYVRTHTFGEIVDNSPELEEYRAYVESVEFKVNNGTIFSGIDASKELHNGSLVLLSASHGLGADTANPRSEWARKNGFEHIAIDLNKYTGHRSPESIGITANWLHLAAIEEAMARSKAEWVWFLDSKYDMATLEGTDPFVILDNLSTFHLEKFPLQSSHRDLKGGIVPPRIDPSQTVFVAASNKVALDTSSLFIRNNDAGTRYMQVWSCRFNLIDDMLWWHLDDQFDGKSQEAFAHMYGSYDFLRQRTVILPQNAIWQSRRTF